MKHILAIHTGGTISMEADANNETVNIGHVNPLVSATKEVGKLARLTVKEPLHKPSPHITVNDMLEIKHLIEAECAAGDIDGVVITHGTDTLEETAFFLDLTLQINVPVILTGAMRSSNEHGSDGLYNFMAAIRTAADDGARDKGVLVVFNDEIYTAREVTKVHTTNVAAFRNVSSGPIGTLTNKSVFFNYEPLPQIRIDVNEITKRVTLIKAYAGMDASIIKAIGELNYDGVVIEALGQGNLPPEAAKGVEELIADGIPVLVVSRCLSGPVQDTYNYPGGGRQLKELGAILCKDLNGPKARLKLLAALTQTDDIDTLKNKYFSD